MRKPFYRKARKAWYCWVNGKQIRLHEDQDTAFDLWGEMRQSGAPSSPSAPLAAVAEAYLQACEKRVADGGLKQSTMDQYGKFVADFCNSFGRSKARSIRRHHLTEFLAKNESWSVHKRRYAISAIKAMMQWAVNEELLNRNPFARYPRPKAGRREHLIESDHHARMMQAEDKGRTKQRRAAVFRQVLIAIRHTGGRSGLVCNATIEKTFLDVPTPYMVVDEHKTRSKTDKPQTVYLSPCLATLARIVSNERKTGPLFRNGQGRQWTADAIGRRFKRIRERLGLPDQTMAYAYRHTYITKALQNGVDIATVAELVGHADTKMIDRHYGHLNQQNRHLSDAAARAVL